MRQTFVNVPHLQIKYQPLFGVIDYNRDPLRLEVGLDHGIAAVSKPLILKLILTRSFELRRSAGFSRPMTVREPRPTRGAEIGIRRYSAASNEGVLTCNAWRLAS